MRLPLVNASPVQIGGFIERKLACGMIVLTTCLPLKGATMENRIFSRLVRFEVIVSLMLVAGASAATYTWIGTQAGDDWLNPANWSPAGQPVTSTDYAYLNTLPGATLYNGIGGAYAIQIGHGPGTNGKLDVYGGSLMAPGGCDIASLAGGIATMNVYGGTGHTIRYLCPGFRGNGTLNMYGGFVRVTNQLRIGYYSTANGTCNLYGGTISAVNIWMAREAGTPVNLKVQDGVLLLDGDKVATVREYINNGWVTVPNENYELVLEYNGTRYPGVTALYTLFNDLSMIPHNNATVRQSTSQLQWTLPEPNLPSGVVTCDVFFGTDPNILLDPKIVNKQAVQSAAVTLDIGTVYYWKIDLYDSSISAGVPYYESRVFTFNTFNVPPTVDAGADIQTWLAGGPRVIQLAGSAIDDDNAPDPIAHMWTVVSQPDLMNPAVVSNPSVLNSTVTLNAIGAYELQLEASDGEYSVIDTMQIVVYSDACEHASNQPGFTWLTGDTNHDCRVNILDLAQLSTQWLELNYSLE